MSPFAFWLIRQAICSVKAPLHSVTGGVTNQRAHSVWAENYRTLSQEKEKKKLFLVALGISLQQWDADSDLWAS